MLINKIILILIIIYIIYLAKNNKEDWRDISFGGNKNPATYQKLSNQIYSTKNLPIYYPISTPLEDTYFNYLGSLSSPKLSMLRNVLNKVIISSNQDTEPLIFNYAERPIDIKKHNPKTIITLTNTIINLINKFGYPIIKVKFISTLNELHEETDQQSRIVFDLKVEVFYRDSEELGKEVKPYYIYIQPEFIFEKKYILDEDLFFNKNNKIEYKSYLSKLILVGSDSFGFLGGRYDKNRN